MSSKKCVRLNCIYYREKRDKNNEEICLYEFSQIKDGVCLRSNGPKLPSSNVFKTAKNNVVDEYVCGEGTPIGDIPEED